MRPSLLLALALAWTSCGFSQHTRMLAVPSGVDDAGLTDWELRERLFRHPGVMFLARQGADGLALVQHYRVQHSTTSTYIPKRVSMTEPLALSSRLILDRATLAADDLVLCLRASAGAPWRCMALDRATLDAATESGRLHLAKIEDLPLLR